MDEIILTKQLKRGIYNALSAREDFLGVYNDFDGILTFLNKIWPLQDMPSEDDRYSNAFDDARQHLVLNSDWSLEYTFLERFKLVEGENIFFNAFLETIVGPEVRRTKEEIQFYAYLINSFVEKSGARMALVDYFEEMPVYKLRSLVSASDLPLEIKINNIPFFKEEIEIDEYPCFVMRYSHWNDYGLRTRIALQYRVSDTDRSQELFVMIMKRDSKTTWDELDDKFFMLKEDFCSCGTSSHFYFDIKEILPHSYQSVLLAIRDVGLFPRISEQFENDNIFKTSFMRDNTKEKMLRTIRFDLNGIDYYQAFKFNFKYRPPYAENDLRLNFDFQSEGVIQHRVYGLIGKNGTGKTQILNAIVSSLSQEAPSTITPRKPIYGKIFTISYSFFDKFSGPPANASFNYVYCGLKKTGGGWLSEDELVERFHASALKIVEKEEVGNWKALLSIFLPAQAVLQMFESDWMGRWSFLPENFKDVYSKVSSGQNILLFVVTEIVAQIRYNSLILYDEPETHLHPNAISELMNMIFELVRRYESFCIIATHSPMIIQELQSRNIYVIEREGNYVSSRKLEKEPFGENLTVITDEVFGNREVPRHYFTLLRKLVDEGREFDEILSLIENDNVPLSLNARLFIKLLISERNEKH
ncbi:ABC-type multidrug transport system, ATPase component [Flavobacterium sp. CF108]|uniref:AbiJ-related protein n=1 Tax=Flavobacterium sp. CF108 TaxID=1882758 RepID=UPI00091E0AC7|nr:AAA family ATPase [Flavobacterium sp. CF108]SHH92361.1 ABC-type multidrug transport system, ATPase component [Flavobacterium sp. CF108]